jgi:hypothetical protein
MKSLLAAIALSTLSTLSFAEASQFEVPAGQLSRAEVIAAIKDGSGAMLLGDATVFAVPAPSPLTRAQVLAAAAADRALPGSHGESSAARLARASDPARLALLAKPMPMAMADAGMHRSDRFGDANRDDFNRRSQ